MDNDISIVSPLEYYMGLYLTRTPGSIDNNLLAVIYCQNFIVKNNSNPTQPRNEALNPV